MRIVVTGYGQHGKNEVCLRIEKFSGLRWCDSSHYMCERIILPVLSPRYGYKTVDECYNDRSNHRKEWFDLICAYNGNDNARLPKEIFREFSVYCGMRNRLELEGGREIGLYDLVIWVDACERKGDAEIGSMSIVKNDADIVVDNNGTLEDLDRKIKALCRFFVR